MAHVSTQSITPEDLLKLPSDRLYELIDGELREKQMGAKANWTATRLSGLLDEYIRANPIGWLISETTYQCFGHKPSQVRRPDISFIRLGRLPGEQLPEGHIPIPPDLVVEVISPNDGAEVVDERIDDYRQCAVPLIWTIYPATRHICISRADRSLIDLRVGQNLTGEDVLPGFSCPVGDIFPKPMAAAKKA